ncbi:MAG: AAA family ATPase [Bacteroidales bacterium]|nr:AAA family ATPase [Bacteroidales bacterium]
MGTRAGYLLDAFLRRFTYGPTSCQEALLGRISEFLTEDDGDILVVNGYAGTGKTSLLAAVIDVMSEFKMPCILLSPTGRSAKVLSQYAGRPAYTIHKHIYRQKSHGDDGFGQFSLSPNKARGALFVVDEVSLIGIDSGTRQGTAEFGSGNLLDDLIRFVRSGVECKLILVGDSAQLPPVGLDASPALSPEYMNSFGGVSYATLTTVVRQASGSGILENATHLRTMLPDVEDGLPADSLGLTVQGFPDVERLSGGDLLEALSDAYSRYGEEETVVLCRSNKRANRYNAGIRAQVQFKEEQLVRGDKLMIVKNCYQFCEGLEGTDYIANGDIAVLESIRNYEDRYGLHFADARLSLPDYGGQEIHAKVVLDTLSSESPALTYEQSNMLYQGVSEDYSHIRGRKKRYDAVREDPFFNALQLKYAEAITCHKAQGGQWQCVFIDNPFWQDFLVADDIKWLYTALTRAVSKVYLVNFKDSSFRTAGT